MDFSSIGTKKSVHNRRLSIKSVHNRGLLLTELKKVTDRGFFFVHNRRLSIIEGSVIEGFYCSSSLISFSSSCVGDFITEELRALFKLQV